MNSFRATSKLRGPRTFMKKNILRAASTNRRNANRGRLSGSVALVTGGTKGIGAATAIALAEEGADVAIVGRRLNSEAKETRRQIEALGRRCLLIAADIALAREATRCVERTARMLGPVDVLVHSAGGPVNGGLLDLTPEAWLSAFDVHVHAI